MSNNVVFGFQTAMLNRGIIPTAPIIADGKLHRGHVQGDRYGTQNLAYVLHNDGKPSGWFMHFKTGINVTWTLSGKREPLTPDLRQQIKQANADLNKELAETRAKAAKKAQWIWCNSKPITKTGQHQYLSSKKIKPHGIRLWRSALVILLIDETGAIVNLQVIDNEGKKRFLKGGKKKSCYSSIGKPTEKILICEGWATGTSLHEATGYYVIVAMDAGNLEPVARVIRDKYPGSNIIVCGDNDWSGVGQDTARKAALAVGGKVFIPPEVGMDWNDYVCRGGVIYV